MIDGDAFVILLGPDGLPRVANAGESSDITATLRDRDNPILNLAAIQTARLTLQDRATGQIINGRDGQDVLNNNGGTFSDATGEVVYTQLLSKDDNVVIGTKQEEHVLTFHYQWIDGGGTARNGIEYWSIQVMPVPAGLASSPGWVG